MIFFHQNWDALINLVKTILIQVKVYSEYRTNDIVDDNIKIIFKDIILIILRMEITMMTVCSMY